MPATATARSATRPKQLPASWSFVAQSGGIEIAAGTDAAPDRRRVRAKLYSGSVVVANLGGLPTRFVIDLSSLRIPSKPIAMRHEKHTDRVGVWERIWLEDGAVWGEGYLLSNAAAQQIAHDADDGFPFETSLSTSHQPEWLDEGKRAVVNGRTVVGPAVIARSALVREASVLTLGADHDTSTVILSERSDTDMADEPTAPVAEGDEAELETISIAEITPEWVRERLPEVAKALAGDDEGAPPAPESTDMAQPDPTPPAPAATPNAAPAAPATLAELQAIAGGDNDAIVWGLQNQMPVAAFKASLEFAQRKVAATEAAGATPQPSRGAPTAPPSAAAASGAKLAAEPDEAWRQSTELQAAWKDKGGQSAFLNFARLCTSEGADWRTEHGPLTAA